MHTRTIQEGAVRFAYTCLLSVLLPIVYLRLLWRSLRQTSYRQRISERFAIYSATTRIVHQSSIHFHCVSVGEILACAALIRRIMQRYPHYHYVITTTTPTGSERVLDLFRQELAERRMDHVYLVYDHPIFVKRFFAHFNIVLSCLMETELWPNFLAISYRKNITSILLNARLSAKSLRNYQRLARLSVPMFKHLSHVVAQSERDAKRFVQLGVASDKVTVAANIKFDVSLSDEQRKIAAHAGELLQADKKTIFLAASTHAGEDEIVRDAFLQACKKALSFGVKTADVLLLIAPRHPERFEQVVAVLAQGLNPQRYSNLLETGVLQGDTSAVVIDSMGQLFALIGASSVVIMGGTFFNLGGHNYLEAAAWAKPIISGHSYFNFSVIADDLIARQALDIAGDKDQLSQLILKHMTQQSQSVKQGELAYQYYVNMQGGLEKHVQVLDAYLHII